MNICLKISCDINPGGSEMLFLFICHQTNDDLREISMKLENTKSVWSEAPLMCTTLIKSGTDFQVIVIDSLADHL